MIRMKKCSCGFTKECGFPCQHILAVALRSEINEGDFTIEARKYETVQQIYNSLCFVMPMSQLKIMFLAFLSYQEDPQLA